jgi:hypothetical protein
LLDLLTDPGDEIDPTDKGVDVLFDRVGETLVVAVTVAEFSLERQPAGALGPGRELVDQDRLSGPAKTGNRPTLSARAAGP